MRTRPPMEIKIQLSLLPLSRPRNIENIVEVSSSDSGKRCIDCIGAAVAQTGRPLKNGQQRSCAGGLAGDGYVVIQVLCRRLYLSVYSPLLDGQKHRHTCTYSSNATTIIGSGLRVAAGSSLMGAITPALGRSSLATCKPLIVCVLSACIGLLLRHVISKFKYSERSNSHY